MLLLLLLLWLLLRSMSSRRAARDLGMADWIMSLRSCCSLSSHSELLSLLHSSGDLLLPEEMTEDADDSCGCGSGGVVVVVVVVGASAAVEDGENGAAFPCGGASVAQLRSLREVAAEKLRGVPSVAKVLSVSAAQSSSAWLWLWLWLWLRGGADCWRCAVCP